MAVYFEDNLNLNNLERNTAVAVKYVGMDEKYVEGDTIALGKLGKGSALRKVYCIVDEAFMDGTEINVGQLSSHATNPALASWATVVPTKRGVYHIPLYQTENYDPDGTPYNEIDDIALDDHMRVGAEFVSIPATNAVGSMRIVYQYDYVDNTQTGAYLS